MKQVKCECGQVIHIGSGTTPPYLCIECDIKRAKSNSSGCSVKPRVIDSAIERYWKLRRESDMVLLDIFEIARNAGEQKKEGE